MKIDPYYHRQKCRPMILVSGSMRFVRIFVEVPRGGAGRQTTVVLSTTAISALSLIIFSDTFEMRPALLYGHQCKSLAGILVSGNIRFVRIFGRIL